MSRSSSLGGQRRGACFKWCAAAFFLKFLGVRKIIKSAREEKQGCVAEERREGRREGGKERVRNFIREKDKE